MVTVKSMKSQLFTTAQLIWESQKAIGYKASIILSSKRATQKGKIPENLL